MKGVAVIAERDLWAPLEVPSGLSWIDFVAIDPGETTGLCAGSVRTSEIQRYGSEGWTAYTSRPDNFRSPHSYGLIGEQIAVQHSFDDGSLNIFSAESWAVRGAIWPWCQLWFEQCRVNRGESLHSHSFEMRNAEGRVIRTLRSSASSALRVVVCEDFVLRERTSDRSLLSPVRLTSMLMDQVQSDIEYYDVMMQSANDKSIIKDDKLKREGLFVPGKQHANDAARHALLFLRKVRVVP